MFVLSIYLMNKDAYIGPDFLQLPVYVSSGGPVFTGVVLRFRVAILNLNGVYTHTLMMSVVIMT